MIKIKFGIFSKLFLALLAATAAIVISMAVSVNWSFRHGFVDYLHQVEVEHLENLVQALERKYAEHGDWTFLRSNRRQWRRILHEVLGDKRPFSLPPELFNEKFPPFPDADRAPWGPPPDGKHRHKRRRHRPPPALRMLIRRLRVLDAERHIVIGAPKAPSETPSDETLRVLQGPDKKTAGWLGIMPLKIISDRLAQRFHEQQAQTYYLIAALAAVISVLISLLLARQLLTPVRYITEGARALSAGRYDTRIRAGGNDELGRLAGDFNTLARTLEQNEKNRRQWIADISHELRTPLAVLRGEIEALQDGVREPSPERLKSLHNEALALGKLVNDLYELALSDLGALDYRRESVDPAALLDNTLAAFRPRFAEKDLMLQYAAPPAVKLFADTRRLQQLFGNILENSLRYTDAGGTLAVSLETDGKTAMLNFQDTAPGVPDEALGRLFERLYRVDKSRSRSLGGAGLGLSICRNIAEAHGGTINARHAPQGGLWIRVELPKEIMNYE
ncbi:MAG: HAMP domain-containing protein [Gammaproteobacteria bacterium]|nr:HAMP domain-containing protein [Gammaproteobacteria bacterium]